MSNYGAEELREALAAGRPALLQNSFSLLYRADEADVIPALRGAALAYQVFGPLAGGWLTGQVPAGRGAAPRGRG